MKTAKYSEELRRTITPSSYRIIGEQVSVVAKRNRGLVGTRSKHSGRYIKKPEISAQGVLQLLSLEKRSIARRAKLQ